MACRLLGPPTDVTVLVVAVDITIAVETVTVIVLVAITMLVTGGTGYFEEQKLWAGP